MAEIHLKRLSAKLNYKFRNIVLLHEALTHNFEKTEENKYFSPFPGVLYKQKDHGRLLTLGARVFEHLIVEQAVNQFANQELTSVTVPPDQKKATRELSSFKAALEKAKYFEVLGEQLSLWEYIKTTKEFRNKLEALYEPVIKAILGAIFIDSGGCYGRVGSKINALKETQKVFLHLWRLTQFDEKATRHLLEEEIAWKLFSTRKLFGSLWKRISVSDYSRMVAYDTKLGYQFQQKWLLRQALTVQQNEAKVEILKAVGDSVWELVICEYLYWFFVNDDGQTHFNDETIELFCNEEFYEAIANALNLKEDLMPKNSGEKAIAKGIELEKDLISKKAAEKAELQIFLKSLVGTIYVDSGNSLASTKKSIVHLCESNRQQIAKSEQIALPHSTKTYRGTYFHALDKYCCIVDHGPPRRQEAFKIRNVGEFVKVTDFREFEVKADHVDQMAMAKKEEKLDFKRILTCSEDQCNQLEYERLSLYHTLDRLRSHSIDVNGDVMNTQHTYGMCLCDGVVATPDCVEVPKEVNPYRLTREFGVITNEELFEALKILLIWVLRCLAASCKKAGAMGWRLTHKIIYAAIYLACLYFCLKITLTGVVWIGTGIIHEIQRNHSQPMSRWERRRALRMGFY